MHIVSSEIETLNINIHNLCPDLELTSPVYFSNGATCHVPPIQQIDTGTIIEASFGIAFKQKDFKGALLYKLQGKYAARTDNLLNNRTASIEDTTTNIYFLVIWYIGDHIHRFYALLIDCSDNFIWDEDKLWVLYRKYSERFKYWDTSTITWLMHSDAIVKTRFDVTYGSDCKLDIVISEGIGKYNMWRPMRIDLGRLVSLLSMLIMLTYVVSLFIEPSVKLNINNQCLNFDLVSPTYAIGDGLELHRLPDHKVCAGDAISSGFISKSDNESNVVLIYRLQKCQAHESTETDEDASNTVHLLVVLNISGSKDLYADVLLVECDKRLDKDDLNDFYLENSNQFRCLSDYATDTWSLDDNTALMITFEFMNEDRTLDITISEVKGYNSTRMPVHIDLKR
jgi:hypothetical protein